ncbi:hypothetical protein AB0F51_38875, partial [Kribbella sp. NPDC023855]
GYASSGLYDTRVGMILVYTAISVPFSAFVIPGGPPPLPDPWSFSLSRSAERHLIVLTASKASLASTCIASTCPYQPLPPTMDWLAAKASICCTVSAAAPPKAGLVLPPSVGRQNWMVHDGSPRLI